MTEAMEQKGKEVLLRLMQAGFEAYFVGGCVRDKMLGRRLKDIDIATSALPDQVIALFPRTVPTGLKHGTVTVIMDGHSFEVTTFRKESEYEQFRRPKQVEFISDLHEDLRRRDFTINAMALAADGRCIDPFGGREDLRNGQIRCVGNPEERFHEDALRMLRGIRFACEYGFELERLTWEALCRHAPLLVHVAIERVTAELEKMIEGRSPDRAVSLLVESRLLRYLGQPVEWPLAVWDRAPEPIAKGTLAGLAEPELRWAALFLLMSMNGQGARKALRQLKVSNKKTEAIAVLADADEWFKSRLDEEDAVPLGCVKFGKQTVFKWLRLAEWQCKTFEAADGLCRLAETGREQAARVPIDRIAQLKVNGSDLTAALDKPPGPWLGVLLNELLTEAAVGKLPNERENLIAAAKQRMEHRAR
jgi:tRNA nucleotidyltransferase (CCA-adding enzyme)